MAEASTFLASKRYAVVTGSNKGIGFEICKQLASKGVMVVLTARDEKRGLQAVEKLTKDSTTLSDHVVFHQLDVVDPTSVAALADFIKAQFGKLDILVNNAGIGGNNITDGDAMRRVVEDNLPQGQIDWNKIMIQTYELAEECLRTNYYGAIRMVQALVPLLQLSDSPRIVNVSSVLGKLQHIPSERVKGVLRDIESLTEAKVDELLKEYLQDYTEGCLETKGWPGHLSAYILSKASLNAYTRMLAKKYPNFIINSVCPGFVKTDITGNTGLLTAEEGAESPVRLALMPDGGPSGVFFFRKEISSFEE